MHTLQVLGAIIGVIVGLTAITSFIWAILKAAKTAGQVSEKFDSKISEAMSRMDNSAALLSLRMETLATAFEQLAKREQARDSKLDNIAGRVIRLEAAVNQSNS